MKTIVYILLFLVVGAYSCQSEHKAPLPNKKPNYTSRNQEHSTTQQRIRSPQANATTSGTSTSQSTTQEAVVIIKQMKFEPAQLKVKKGQTVTWINKDIVEHDITPFNTKLPHSGVFKPRQSWQLEVDQSFDYKCNLHPTMLGKIIVE
ncbi:plastocyanin/azurin family copper-binding protein [Myroides sp. LJL116]